MPGLSTTAWNRFLVARLSCAALALFCRGAFTAPAAAAETAPNAPAAGTEKPASAADLEFYQQQVRPILAAHCFDCHSHGARQSEGDLVLDFRGAILKGGSRGAAVVPGQPGKSLLISAVRRSDPNLEMPPEGDPLSAQQIARLEEWIRRGVPMPGGDQPLPAREKISAEDRAWWAFQPVRRPPVPDVDDQGWSRSPIDRFIWQRLAQEGLTPAPEAQRRVLMRRLYFDLVGMPPKPAEIAAFLADDSADAYERLVDRLLASPQYGERWARHWLDLVRYAESDGFRLDEYRSNAWYYRDYVIRSLNDDKPYDRFVQEQLAGDELAPHDPDALAATGFLRHTIYEYNQRDVRTQWSDMLNDLTDVTGDVFLGLGMGCARCHDHKFDPLLQRDYFALQSFFAAFLPVDNVPLATTEALAQQAQQQQAWEAKAGDILQQIAEFEAPFRQRAADGAIEKFPPDIQAMIRTPAAQRGPLEHQLAELAYRQVLYEFDRLDTKLKDDQKQELAALKRQLLPFDGLKPPPLPLGRTVRDAAGTAPAVYVPKKEQAGEVLPAFPVVMTAEPPQIEPISGAQPSTGRRLALARWLTRPDHPLVPRVIVNRVWQYHLGQGLVRTASDFGRLGEKPSHPELLDYLAAEFVAQGWSLKKLHRQLVTSAVYRQSATAPASSRAMQIDPENRLWWRGTTRRLDAEQIRDNILAVSGELNLTIGGPAVDASTPRRSIYVKVARNTRDPLLDAFDLPEGFTSTPQRNVTTSPTQALLLFNGQSFLQRARALAKRLQSLEPGASDAAFVRRAYSELYGRSASEAEVQAAVAFLQRQTQRIDPAAEVGPGFFTERLPTRDGGAAWLDPKGVQKRLLTLDPLPAVPDEFTIEACLLLRSVNDDGTVRTIASQWNGSKAGPGWSLGVTSRKSAFKPQSLVLQLVGQPTGENPAVAWEPVFAGLHIALDKPYYVAAVVQLKDCEPSGITFYAKDLSNDDEPMQTAHLAHKTVRLGDGPQRVVVGGHAGAAQATWDGLIDEVRLTAAALPEEQLLLARDGISQQTLGYWRFEANPSPYADSSTGRHRLADASQLPGASGDKHEAARIDFCHALLNSNEFLYVD